MGIIAILAFFVIFKLFKEFGKTKDAQATMANDIEKEKLKRAVMDNIVNSINSNSECYEKTQEDNDVLEKEVASLQDRFPGFLIVSFLTKAEEIFDTIFNAFANSHHHTLKNMLTEPLYESFAEQIKKREEANLRQEILIKHKKTTMEKIQLLANKAKIFVSFDVSQMSAIINSDGASFDNPKRIYRDVLHKWVFERDTGDESWILSKTSSVEK